MVTQTHNLSAERPRKEEPCNFKATCTERLRLAYDTRWNCLKKKKSESGQEGEGVVPSEEFLLACLEF